MQQQRHHYRCLLIFTDFSDFLGRQTRLQKPPDALGVEESSSPRRVLHFECSNSSGDATASSAATSQEGAATKKGGGKGGGKRKPAAKATSLPDRVAVLEARMGQNTKGILGNTDAIRDIPGVLKYAWAFAEETRQIFPSQGFPESPKIKTKLYKKRCSGVPSGL